MVRSGMGRPNKDRWFSAAPLGSSDNAGPFSTAPWGARRTPGPSRRPPWGTRTLGMLVYLTPLAAPKSRKPDI